MKSLQDLTITCEGGYDESDWSDSDFEDEPEEEENMEEETDSILCASTSNRNIAASTNHTNIAATTNIANIAVDISASKTSLKDVSSFVCSRKSVELASWNLLRLSKKKVGLEIFCTTV